MANKKSLTLTAEDLCKMLEDSADFMSKVTNGFKERNERIFYRKPVRDSSGQMEYSELVDNTLASYLEKMPKNVIQKLPTFKLSAHNHSQADDLVYEYIANKIILKNGSSRGYSLLQKQWIELRNAATFGACASYLSFEMDDGTYTVGESPIYWGDLFPEAYASNLNSANYTIFRTLKTKGDLQKIIDSGDVEQGAKWDTAALQNVIDSGTGTGIARETTGANVMLADLPSNLYELFIYTDNDWVVTFHYLTKQILRVIPNRSHRQRVRALYSDYDGSSIMGRSMVDMAFGIQQTLTSLLRNFVYISDYNTDPAMFVKGVTLDADSFSLDKGNKMFLSDEDGNVTTLPIDTKTVENFPALYSLMKTVLLTSLPSSSETGISSGVGDPTYSKTQAGVDTQNNKADIENNYYRKNYESYFEMVLEDKLNIYLAELKALSGSNDGAYLLVQLDDDYADQVRAVDPNFVNDKNQVQLDVSDVDNVSVEVDFDSTRDMAREDDLKRLNTFMTGFFEVAKSDPDLAKMMRKVLPLLMEEMAKSSNLENSGKIVEAMNQSLADASAEPQSGDGGKDAPKPPTVSISFKDLPPSGQIQAAADYGITLTPQDVQQNIAQENLARDATDIANGLLHVSKTPTMPGAVNTLGGQNV